MLLAVFIALIGGYLFVTDSDRVKAQAENYLGRLVGGEVTVEHATLGLFDGLRLEGVTVRTSDDKEQPDATVFTARSVTIDYDPFSLLAGDLSAGRVVATDPHVRLVENVVDGSWNIQRLGLFRPRKDKDGKPFRPPERLPEVSLRNTQVDYSRRIGPLLEERGGVSIEALFQPQQSGEEGSSYRFAIQTQRYGGDDLLLGPRADGTIQLGGGETGGAIAVSAQLRDLNFATLRDLLPRKAADWARRHEVEGQIEAPQIEYHFDPAAPKGSEIDLRLRVVLKEGSILGLPENWLPPEEFESRQAAAWLADRVATSQASWLPKDVKQVAANLATAWRPRPIHLTDVGGEFIFSDDGVIVRGLVGSLEGNRLRINGSIDGYDRDAPIAFTVADAGRPIELPSVLPYLSSLPRPVREVYRRFSPRGTCRLRLEFDRGHREIDGTVVTGRPVVTGEIEVLDGSFELDRLPYRIFAARGKLLLRHDREPGVVEQDRLVIENLTGRGAPGSPNEDALITVNGTVAPLNHVAGFDVAVVGRNVNDSPLLRSALPSQVQRVIRQFDPQHFADAETAATLPELSFAGDFEARVSRPPGPNQRWDFRVGLDLKQVRGAFAFFPYPVDSGTARVTVRRDSALLHRATITRQGEAHMTTADINGRIDWGNDSPLQYDLRIFADDVPTDAALWRALPPVATETAQSLGLAGVANAKARVFSTANGSPRYDVTLDVRDGLFWPTADTFNLSDIRGRVRLRPGLVELIDIVGQRGDGSVSAIGTIGTDADGRTALTLAASNFPLEGDLYQLLPSAAQEAWDWLRPEGTVDADVQFDVPTALLASRRNPADDAVATSVASAASEVSYDVELRPNGINLLPSGLPYALQNVHGSIHIQPGEVILTDVTADHAVAEGPPARLALNGIGDFRDEAIPAGKWTLQPHFSDVPVDAELLTALPQGVSDMLEAISFRGRIGGDFDVLQITPQPVAASPADITGEPAGEAPPPNVLFKGRLTASDADFDIGVAVGNFTGQSSFAGSYENGELYELSGEVTASSYTLSEREAGDLTLSFALPAGGDALAFSNISSNIAGGVMDGSAALTFAQTPEGESRNRFTVHLDVVGVDVQKLLGEDEIGDGRLTAGLDLRGVVGAPASREGRGRVFVEGDKLFKLPLVLGLLQVTNLALPIAEPFSEAEVQFDIGGPLLRFEKLELRATSGPRNTRGMELTGRGTLNYETGRMLMTFDTSNRGWDAIPLVGDLVGLARNELIGVEITGTLARPEVSGRSLPTVLGTFDRAVSK